MSPPKPVEEKPRIAADEGNWVHCKLDWLKPDKIKDAQKRRPDHPDYDPSTLFVPTDFYKNQTPVSMFCMCIVLKYFRFFLNTLASLAVDVERSFNSYYTN